MVYSKENDELMHYGILGMKWGRRKNTSAESKTASMTTFLFLRTIIMHSYEKILFNYERSNYYV